MDWQWQAWAQLAPDTLYAFLKLRSDVFVVEQNCVFPEMDGLDPLCEHLCGFDRRGALAAYLRVLPPGLRRPHSDAPPAPGPAIGRVVVAPPHRGCGLGRVLMQQGIDHCQRRYPAEPIFVSAQQHLQRFYASLGFENLRAAYVEDGIPHVDMRRAAILGP